MLNVPKKVKRILITILALGLVLIATVGFTQNQRNTDTSTIGIQEQKLLTRNYEIRKSIADEDQFLVVGNRESPVVIDLQGSPAASARSGEDLTIVESLHGDIGARFYQRVNNGGEDKYISFFKRGTESAQLLYTLDMPPSSGIEWAVVDWIDDSMVVLVSSKFDPDGGFYQEMSGMHILDVEDGSLIDIPLNPDFLSFPKISPNGRYMIYSVSAGQSRDLWEDNADQIWIFDLKTFLETGERIERPVTTETGKFQGWTTTPEILNELSRVSVGGFSFGRNSQDCNDCGDEVALYHLPWECGHAMAVSRDGDCTAESCGHSGTEASVKGWRAYTEIHGGKRAFDFSDTYLANRYQPKVLCARGGVLVFAGWENENDKTQGFGKFVLIDHGDGSFAYYGHMSKLASLRAGGDIEVGDVLGWEGNTGSSTGEHIHLEVRLGGGKESTIYPRFIELGADVVPTQGYVYISQNGSDTPCNRLDCEKVTNVVDNVFYENQSNAEGSANIATYYSNPLEFEKTDVYGVAPANWNESGNERVYRFSVKETPVRVVVSDIQTGKDVDVFVLQGNYCDNLDPIKDCIGRSCSSTTDKYTDACISNVPARTHVVDVEATDMKSEYTDMYIVVDGKETATYSLKILTGELAQVPFSAKCNDQYEPNNTLITPAWIDVANNEWENGFTKTLEVCSGGNQDIRDIFGFTLNEEINGEFQVSFLGHEDIKVRLHDANFFSLAEGDEISYSTCNLDGSFCRRCEKMYLELVFPDLDKYTNGVATVTWIPAEDCQRESSLLTAQSRQSFEVSLSSNQICQGESFTITHKGGGDNYVIVAFEDDLVIATEGTSTEIYLTQSQEILVYGEGDDPCHSRGEIVKRYVTVTDCQNECTQACSSPNVTLSKATHGGQYIVLATMEALADEYQLRCRYQDGIWQESYWEDSNATLTGLKSGEIEVQAKAICEGDCQSGWSSSQYLVLPTLTAGKMDLVCTTTIEDKGVTAGEDIVFTVTVCNQGATAMPYQSKVFTTSWLSMSGSFDPSKSIALPESHQLITSLDAGACTEIDVRASVPDGTDADNYFLYSEVNSYPVLLTGEARMDNNQTRQSIKIGGEYDVAYSNFELAEIELDKVDYDDNELSLDLDITVKETNGVDYGGQVTCFIYASKNKRLDYDSSNPKDAADIPFTKGGIAYWSKFSGGNSERLRMDLSLTMDQIQEAMDFTDTNIDEVSDINYIIVELVMPYWSEATTTGEKYMVINLADYSRCKENGQSDLKFENITQSSINLNWRKHQTLKEQQVRYRVKGSNDWTNFTTKQEDYMIRGLTAGTTYEVHKRNICNTGSYLSWQSIVSFTTKSIASANILITALDATPETNLLRSTQGMVRVSFVNEGEQASEQSSAKLYLANHEESGAVGEVQTIDIPPLAPAHYHHVSVPMSYVDTQQDTMYLIVKTDTKARSQGDSKTEMVTFKTTPPACPELDSMKIIETVIDCQEDLVALYLTGTKASYSYSWNTGDNGGDVLATSGDYEVIITDEAGCQRIMIHQIAPLECSFTLGVRVTDANQLPLDGVVGMIDEAVFGRSAETGIITTELESEGMVSTAKTSEDAFGITWEDAQVVMNHLLGIKPITNPYSLIAADVDESGSITGRDLLYIHRVGVMKTRTWPTPWNWKFFNQEQAFSNPRQPWNDVWKHDAYVSADNNNPTFIGIKRGDVTQGAAGRSKVDHSAIMAYLDSYMDQNETLSPQIQISYQSGSVTVTADEPTMVTIADRFGRVLHHSKQKAQVHVLPVILQTSEVIVVQVVGATTTQTKKVAVVR